MWIMENDPECLYLTFSVDEEVFGVVWRFFADVQPLIGHSAFPTALLCNSFSALEKTLFGTAFAMATCLSR